MQTKVTVLSPKFKDLFINAMQKEIQKQSDGYDTEDDMPLSQLKQKQTRQSDDKIDSMTLDNSIVIDLSPEQVNAEKTNEKVDPIEQTIGGEVQQPVTRIDEVEQGSDMSIDQPGQQAIRESEKGQQGSIRPIGPIDPVNRNGVGETQQTQGCSTVENAANQNEENSSQLIGIMQRMDWQMR